MSAHFKSSLYTTFLYYFFLHQTTRHDARYEQE